VQFSVGATEIPLNKTWDIDLLQTVSGTGHQDHLLAQDMNSKDMNGWPDMMAPTSANTGKAFTRQRNTSPSIILQFLGASDRASLMKNIMQRHTPGIGILRAIFQNTSNTLF
jgi:hypothetical protein